MDNAKFLEKVEVVHGGRYTYPGLDSPKSSSKIRVVCKTHGEFLQTCGNHLNGRGCRQCGVEQRSDLRRKSSGSFVRDARQVHGDVYDYSQVDYKGTRSKVTIVCGTHGAFDQVPDSHLRGAGCPACHCPIKAAKTPKERLGAFLDKAREVHGDKYSYENVEYTLSQAKVPITCPDHGEFKQTPNKHLLGQGCPKCTPDVGIFSFKTWSQEKLLEHFMDNAGLACSCYLLRIEFENEFFYKVGITTRDINERLTEIRKRSKPSVVALVAIFESNYLKSHYMEYRVLDELQKDGYKPSRQFKGWTECFEFTSESALTEKFLATCSLANDQTDEEILANLRNLSNPEDT